MKRILAGLLTMIVMSLMIRTALNRPPSTDSEPDARLQDSQSLDRARTTGATACIEGLLTAARAGDVASYLAAFGGPSRDRLAREADEIGRDAFALRLRRAGLARKSHAIFAPESDGDRRDAVRITVESTFADRIERQTFRLEQADGSWLVTEIETAREHVPKSPLGSLAKYDEPEGPPVAAESGEPGGDEIEN
jgi:hypothetical protein